MELLWIRGFELLIDCASDGFQRVAIATATPVARNRRRESSLRIAILAGNDSSRLPGPNLRVLVMEQD